VLKKLIEAAPPRVGHRSSQSSAKEFAAGKSGFGQAREIVHWDPPYVVTAKQS
jgi:hypothetical protein